MYVHVELSHRPVIYPQHVELTFQQPRLPRTRRNRLNPLVLIGIHEYESKCCYVCLFLCVSVCDNGSTRTCSRFVVLVSRSRFIRYSPNPPSLRSRDVSSRDVHEVHHGFFAGDNKVFVFFVNTHGLGDEANRATIE